MTWWVTNPGRAKAERLGVAELLDASAWLVSAKWKLDDMGRLTALVVIRHRNEDFPVTMTYPDYFPDVPPALVPVDSRRLSKHQYPSGDLCLERRADNWSPDVTGAMMIESAHGLIAGERIGDGAPPVPSAHEVAIGQTIRNEVLRFVVEDEVLDDLRRRSRGGETFVWLRMQFAADNIVTFIEAVGDDCGAAPIEGRSLGGVWRRRATAIRVPGDLELQDDVTIEGLARVLRAVGLWRLADEVGSADEAAYLILVSDTAAQLLLVQGSGEARSITRDATVVMPSDAKRRNHPENAALQAKAVAIVGCGSVGSKIAVTLARAGVGRFVLVDHDILFPQNLQRHDLDGRFVGTHKADGLRQRICETVDATVVVRKVALGGQESAETLTSVLDELATCDLIIDATADPKVFNYCASVSRGRTKAMLWVEVLAGGIGGLVARSRPWLDPPPQEARLQITRWTQARGVPAPQISDVSYGIVESDTVLIADDADVSVVAAHASRLAVDTLVRPERSSFPTSAYFVGLSAAWIFAAPFDTWPITYVPEGDWETTVDADTAAQALDLLRSLTVRESGDDPLFVE